LIQDAAAWVAMHLDPDWTRAQIEDLALAVHIAVPSGGKKATVVAAVKQIARRAQRNVAFDDNGDLMPIYQTGVS
jgi:hypothetical protein